MQMSPPRGAEIVELLLRHRDRPDAGAGLDDLVARWDRLGEDMRRWIQAKHPELHPDRWRAGSEALSATDGEPEEPLTWPPPTIERDGDAWLLSFDDATARSATRERFEELARAAPAFEVLDGDREWLRVWIGAADPHRAVRDLWEESGPG